MELQTERSRMSWRKKMSFGSYLELHPTCFSVEMHVCTCAARDLVDRLDLNNGRNDILDACVV